MTAEPTLEVTSCSIIVLMNSLVLYVKRSIRYDTYTYAHAVLSNFSQNNILGKVKRLRDKP